MKKILAMALVLMMTFALAASAEQTLVIGGTGPLTGDYATYGISARNGAIMARSCRMASCSDSPPCPRGWRRRVSE